MEQPPLKIALTGGIGSGKSTVARMLVDCGAALFDADAVSRELTAPGGAALAEIVKTFGPESLAPDGGMNRPWMRERVFADAQARRGLEGILHPLIAERAITVQAQAAGKPLVLDIPLLGPHSAWRRSADRVLVVDCAVSTQIRRVMARSGLTQEEVQRIIDSQLDRARRRALADAVIVNEDEPGLDGLRLDVQRLWTHWHPG